MKKNRKRILHFVKLELLKKSREAALSAVQIYNSPSINFKSETFVVLIIIAWTYLFHAYYRDMKIEYRYFKINGKKKFFDKTKHGAFKHWELERCINDTECPLELSVILNLKFLIGLRHEIEHQMTTRIDGLLSARFQACCINYHETIVKFFGEEFGIAKHLTLSLQFSSLEREQLDLLSQHPNLPPQIRSYISNFDSKISKTDFSDPKFAYRVIFVPKLANHINQADQVITFVKADSDLAKTINMTYTVFKESEHPKWLPSAIVQAMKTAGFEKFGMIHHTKLWQSLDAKNPKSSYGVQIANTWYWYKSWFEVVKKHCEENSHRY